MKPNWFDWLVYRLFYWRWNKILRNNNRLREFFLRYMQCYEGMEVQEVANGPILSAEQIQRTVECPN